MPIEVGYRPFVNPTVRNNGSVPTVESLGLGSDLKKSAVIGSTPLSPSVVKKTLVQNPASLNETQSSESTAIRPKSLQGIKGPITVDHIDALAEKHAMEDNFALTTEAKSRQPEKPALNLNARTLFLPDEQA